MGYGSWPNESQVREQDNTCDSSRPATVPPRLIGLSVKDGSLYAEYDRRDGHTVGVLSVLDEQVVNIGCIKTTREALKMIADEIAKDDERQRVNVERLNRAAKVKRRVGRLIDTRSEI